MTLKQSTNPYGYRNLLVYKKAEESQMACATLTASFPKEKTLVALADQMDRSARSVKQNVVEGWKRNSTKEYYEFLGFSLGANAELEEDCNDIIKGVYPSLKGLKGAMGERGENQKGGQRGIDQKGERGINQMGEMGFEIKREEKGSTLSLDYVERLPFYPLDTRLPLLVQLKLRCKELNMLIDKLQRALLQKMTEERRLPHAEMLGQAHKRKVEDEQWLEIFLAKQGFVRLPNGRVVRV